MKNTTSKPTEKNNKTEIAENKPRAIASGINVWCRHDELKDVTELVENPRNPNKHPDKQIALLAKIIRGQGWRQPITVSKRSGFIVKGHGRYQAAKVLNVELVPVEYQDYETEAAEYADLMADNRIAELAEPDADMIDDLLKDAMFEDFDMDLTGFEITPLFEGNDDDFDADAAADEIVEPITKLGDIWTLGRHRLMCGDSTDRETVDRLMDGQKADMVFTDPPYGYEYQSNMRTKTEKFDVLKNDDKVLNFMPLIPLVSNGFVFICTTWKVLNVWLPLFMEHFELTNMVVWDKGGGGIGDLKKTFSTDYEIILISHRGNELKGKRIGSVWNVPKDSASDYEHATQKPIKLSSLAIDETTNVNDTVLDLFGGSGSTLIACEQLNRTCYMMELDPKYCDVIVKRWENITGEKAVIL